MENDQLGRLRDILDACLLVERYVDGVTVEDFRENLEKQDAVIRRIEIIGEATAHLSETTRGSLPELPFRQIRGMRNIVAHDYANVDIDSVWEIATVHLVVVRNVLEKFFQELD